MRDVTITSSFYTLSPVGSLQKSSAALQEGEHQRRGPQLRLLNARVARKLAVQQMVLTHSAFVPASYRAVRFHKRRLGRKAIPRLRFANGANQQMEIEDLAKAHAELVDATGRLLEGGEVSTAAIDQLNAAKRSFDAACSGALHLLVLPLHAHAPSRHVMAGCRTAVACSVNV